MTPAPSDAAPRDSAEEAMLRAIRTKAILLTAAGVAVALPAFGPRAAVSLTIAATIVILSFLGIEKATGKILKPRTGMRLSDFLFPVGGFLALLLLVGLLLRWRGFDRIAGLAGFSVVVVAIGWEGLRGRGK